MGPRSNLRVETQAHATSIMFEGKRAAGVKYRKGSELKEIRARREVILSAGAFQAPQLLMLSGVGDAQETREARHCKPASSARRLKKFARPSRLRLQLPIR
jgi:choline dehydrogenase-like flavoprotein